MLHPQLHQCPSTELPLPICCSRPDSKLKTDSISEATIFSNPEETSPAPWRVVSTEDVLPTCSFWSNLPVYLLLLHLQFLSLHSHPAAVKDCCYSHSAACKDCYFTPAAVKDCYYSHSAACKDCYSNSAACKDCHSHSAALKDCHSHSAALKDCHSHSAACKDCHPQHFAAFKDCQFQLDLVTVLLLHLATDLSRFYCFSASSHPAAYLPQSQRGKPTTIHNIRQNSMAEYAISIFTSERSDFYYFGSHFSFHLQFALHLAKFPMAATQPRTFYFFLKRLCHSTRRRDCHHSLHKNKLHIKRLDTLFPREYVQSRITFCLDSLQNPAAPLQPNT